MKKLFLIFLITASSFLWASEEVLIEDSSVVSRLNTIQENLDNVSTAVMSCIESGKEHSACMCQNKTLIIQFNTSVKTLFEEFTDLEKLDLIRFKATDGDWVTQSLKGILKQANTELTCAGTIAQQAVLDSAIRRFICSPLDLKATHS